MVTLEHAYVSPLCLATVDGDVHGTLALREGDPTALGFYADNRRIHVGELGTVADQAYEAWAADRAAGLDSVLLAPARETVTRLNERARADRLATMRAPRGREARLADGTRASRGDTILTRRNERRLVTSSSNWVKNGDRWSVETVHPDGSMKVRHLDHQRSVTLPPGYVNEHVQLGYAATVHTAQGMTTDTAHVVVNGDDSRQLLYVGLSRGRQANHVYLGHGPDGDLGSLLRPDAVRPPTAIEVITRILERDGSQHSATTTRHELDSPATQLRDAVARYRDALGHAAEQVVGPEALASLGQQVDAIWPGLTAEPAYPSLRGHLALRSLAGADPLDLLLDAAAGRERKTALDRAAVLDWRLENSVGEGPLPWLPVVPLALALHPEWGSYLEARAHRVTNLASQVRHDAATWPPGDAPAWTSSFPAASGADLRGNVAVWRAAFGVPASDDRPTGRPQPGVDAAAHQSHLNRRLHHAVGDAATPGTWRTVLPEVVRADPYAENLGRRLTTLAWAGIDPTRLIEDALAERRPLPVEHAAGALWWRIVRNVDPAALRDTTARPAEGNQDGVGSRWIAQLAETLPAIEVNPGWPRLLDTLHRAHADGYDVHRLLTRTLTTPLPIDERTAENLRWRIKAAVDPDPRPPLAAVVVPPTPAADEAHQACRSLTIRPSNPRGPTR